MATAPRRSVDLALLRGRGALYWITLMFTIAASLLISDLLNRTAFWQSVRFSAFRVLQDITDRRTHAVKTTLVMIDDEDYYTREVYRSPLPRDYIAKLVMKIAKAHPDVIALDIGLQRSPGEERYAGETEILRTAFESVEATTTIVLATVLNRDAKTNLWIPEPNILNEASFHRRNVTSGFTQLARDLSEIRLWVPVKGARVLSFSTAIARSVDPRAVDEVAHTAAEHPPFSTFMPEPYFPIVRPSDLDSQQAIDTLKHSVVIVGGRWRMPGQIARIDSYETPVGILSGALVHANYVESLLTPGGTKRAMEERTRVGLEIVLALAVALSFIVCSWRMRISFLIGLALMVIILSIFSWQMNGVFFDGLMSLVLIVGHAELERRDVFEQQPRTLLRALVWITVTIAVITVIVLRHRVDTQFVGDRPGMVVESPKPEAQPAPVPDQSSEQRKLVTLDPRVGRPKKNRETPKLPQTPAPERKQFQEVQVGKDAGSTTSEKTVIADAELLRVQQERLTRTIEMERARYQKRVIDMEHAKTADENRAEMERVRENVLRSLGSLSEALKSSEVFSDRETLDDPSLESLIEGLTSLPAPRALSLRSRFIRGFSALFENSNACQSVFGRLSSPLHPIVYRGALILGIPNETSLLSSKVQMDLRWMIDSAGASGAAFVILTTDQRAAPAVGKLVDLGLTNYPITERVVAPNSRLADEVRSLTLEHAVLIIVFTQPDDHCAPALSK